MRRIGGDGGACGHRLQDHQAKGVRPTGEDEDVGVAEAAGQVFPELGAEELGLRILLLKLGAGGAVLAAVSIVFQSLPLFIAG